MNAQAGNLLENVLGTKPVAQESAMAAVSSTETMNAIVWLGKKKVEYARVPKVMITSPADALVRVTATTLCGSDLHLYTGEMPNMRKGDVIGHEAMGVVEAVGQEVKDIRVGQRVVIAFDIACGTCPHCQRQEYTGCERTNPSKAMEAMYGHCTAGLFGYSHLTGGRQGCQAEYVSVPFADVNLLPIEDEIPDEKALYLSDIAPTSFHACELGEVRQGCSVAVWGLGPVGMLALQWCKILGASTIIGVEVVPERMAMARQLGYTVIEGGSNQEVYDRISKLVPGGLDVSIEAAGFRYATSLLHKVERALSLETDTADLLTQCIQCTRTYGNVSIIGDYAGYANHFPIGALMEKHLTVRGGQSPTQKLWKAVKEMIRKNEFNPLEVVNYSGTLDELPRLYQQFNDKEGGLMKVFLRPNPSAVPKNERQQPEAPMVDTAANQYAIPSASMQQLQPTDTTFTSAQFDAQPSIM